MAALLAAALLFGASPSADLRIAIWPQGKSGARHVWTLRCSPPTGTLPHAAEACKRLSRRGADAFAPVPPDRACLQIYGGSQEALVMGTFAGRRVWARFNRRDGCQIARWNRIRFLFVAPGATA